MGLSYSSQGSVDLLGSAASVKTLTGSYTTDGTNDASLAVGGMSQVVLYIGYTMGTAETGNSLQLKIAFSPDSDTSASSRWFREVTSAISSGTVTLSLGEYTFTATGAAGTYDYIRLTVPVCDAIMRVSVKETGIATNGGKVFIKALAGGA